MPLRHGNEGTITWSGTPSLASTHVHFWTAAWGIEVEAATPVNNTAPSWSFGLPYGRATVRTWVDSAGSYADVSADQTITLTLNPSGPQSQACVIVAKRIVTESRQPTPKIEIEYEVVFGSAI